MQPAVQPNPSSATCGYFPLCYAVTMNENAITTKNLESLLNPSVYPVDTIRVDLIQTHVSWLFLTDTHVFKIKKPVNFGFLDFSTLDLRHFYCNEELRLNRRLCPEIYEQVIALRQTISGASFVGDGAIIDYAVMMKRLPADRMLDRLVDRGNITLDEIKTIAFKISSFHSNAMTSDHIDKFGSLEQIRYNWQENFQQTAQFNSTTLPQKISNTIRLFIDNFIESNSPLFESRVNNGFIRECDGDIHSGNICLADKSAYIFDCIEFNERFRHSDTTADIAFLLMDLDYHGRSDLADAALSAYIEASGDLDCANLITFYKIYRAFVRGKVESMQLLDSGIDLKARDEAEKRAKRYFRLAQGYCLRVTLSPTLFITCGTMGCGKSSLCQQISFELGIATYNSDVIRKQMAGIKPEASVNVSYLNGLYSKDYSYMTYRQLEQLAEVELASGRSVLIDASFGTFAERNAFAALAASHQADFVILYLHCDNKEQRLRLNKRSATGGSVSDGRTELLDNQISSFEVPDKSENVIIKCDTSENSEQAVEQVYKRLFQS